MTYRTNGAVGALLDEYERSLNDLKKVIAPLSKAQLLHVVDSETTDLDCQSIQTILSHIAQSGHAYVIYIRNHLGESIAFKETQLLDSIQDYNLALDDMFKANENLFHDYPDMTLEVFEQHEKIKGGWGNYYDVEQMMEHAIVHVLRHRRQIERFIKTLDN